MLSKNVLTEINDQVTQVLKKHHALKEGETVKITLEITSNPLVSIVAKQLENDDTKILQRALNKMKHNRVRMAGVVNNHNLTLSDLKAWGSRIPHYRNVGMKALSEFARVLQEEGVDVPWAESVSDQPKGIAAEVARGVVKDITSQQWDEMSSSFFSPERKHSKTHRAALDKIRNGNNSPFPIKDAFPKSMHASWWKSMVSLINLRWKSRGLPFRLKFVSTATFKRRFDGTLQVVTLE